MKILFLDIDGVICTTRSHLALSYGTPVMDKFDPCVAWFIRDICARTGCKLVLSSSWRLHEGWEAKLHHQGIWNNLFHDDKQTTKPRLTDIRGNEIREWLSRHPEVTHYAIVDDNSDMLPEQRTFFVQTKFDDGMLVKDYLKILEILGAPRAIV